MTVSGIQQQVQGGIGAYGAQVRFERVQKRFGPVVAVDGVSLDVGPGEFLTLLGPSGSGKTTTLMMLAGFEIPTAGEIWVDDTAIAAIPPYKRNIGMVFQSYALFPHMTVGENIAFPLKMRGISKSEIAKQSKEALELVKLPGYEGRYPRQLSGGQQQRIAVARALVFNPRVLLMDEPLGALDKQLRESLQLEIKQLHDQLGVTIVYVTHDQQEALVMSDRIAVMNEGRIEQIGSPIELYDQPQSRFVASFIGESNFLSGTVAKSANGRCEIDVPGVGRLVSPHMAEAVDGGEVTVTVRPEKLVFANGAMDGMNTAPGRVENVIFAGEMRRYDVVLPNDARLVLKRPNRAGEAQHERGEEVMVAWEYVDTRLV
ncbi:MAG TPA: ABC transporter ATP-binding protein [Thermomicrobiales bacterium]|nr:ABC transporter ATP-binding protein [Thermomicrobiales bacterium]